MAPRKHFTAAGMMSFAYSEIERLAVNYRREAVAVCISDFTPARCRDFTQTFAGIPDIREIVERSGFFAIYRASDLVHCFHLLQVYALI